MTHITLTSDQSQLVANATDGLVFCDASGNVIVRVPPPISDEEVAIIAEAKRRLAADQPRSLFSDVVKRLKDRDQERQMRSP